jgi:hypothetical protein
MIVAVFIASCGGARQGPVSDAGDGPDCGPLTYISGDACRPLQIGAGADATFDGEATDAAASWRGGGDAADGTSDAGRAGTPDSSEDSTGGAALDVVLSDQCTNGVISIASDILNPGDVYLDGTLTEGACYRDALTHWSDPNSACTGFGCYFDGRGAVIRPSDGRMLYMNTFENVIREFHADSCPMPAMSTYPQDRTRSRGARRQLERRESCQFDDRRVPAGSQWSVPFALGHPRRVRRAPPDIERPGEFRGHNRAARRAREQSGRLRRSHDAAGAYSYFVSDQRPMT